MYEYYHLVMNYLFPKENKSEIVLPEKWKHTLNRKIENTYSHLTGEIMFEFTYRVSHHNSSGSGNLEPPNFDIRIPFKTIYLGYEINVGWLFYSTSLDIIVIAFTGTYNKLLCWWDMEYSQTTPATLHNAVTDMKLHNGFWDLYQRIQSDIIQHITTYCKETTQLLIVGYSLGGALSHTASLDLHHRKLESGIVLDNIIQYSFGAPRVFNTIGADHYENLALTSYRIVNLSDLIPTVPFPVMEIISTTNVDFKHVGKLIFFDTNLNGYYSNHSQAYVQHYNLI